MHFRALNPVFEPVVGVSEYAAASLLEVLYILDQFKSIVAAAHEYLSPELLLRISRHCLRCLGGWFLRRKCRPVQCKHGFWIVHHYRADTHSDEAAPWCCT